MIESFRRAIRDRPIGPERRVAFMTCFDQPLLAADIEDRVLLSGERCVGQIFGRRRRANRDLESLFADSLAEALIRIRGSATRLLSETASRASSLRASLADTCEFFEIVDVETLEKFLQAFAKAVGFEQRVIGVAGRRKSVDGTNALSR